MREMDFSIVRMAEFAWSIFEPAEGEFSFELFARIVREMANHYKDHPNVVGWQIDNELNCEINVFYSESDHVAFRKWLKEKYGKLDNLNKAWGAVFWNQKYTDWDQIYLTRP